MRGSRGQASAIVLDGVLASLVLLAVIGRDLGLQRAAEPVNPRLDLLSRVRILMHEHRTHIGQQAAHKPRGTGEGHPLGDKAVMEELGKRLEDRLALVEVGRGIVGHALRWERRERRGGPPRPGIALEVRQRVRHGRLQSVACLVTLRTDQGDERAPGDEGTGQTERLRRTIEVITIYGILCLPS